MLGINLSPGQYAKLHKQFVEDRIVRIPHALLAAQAEAAVDALWHQLERRYCIDRSDPTSWDHTEGLFEYGGALRVYKFKRERHSLYNKPVFRTIRSDVTSFVSQVFHNAEFRTTKMNTKFVINFPSREPNREWTVPRQVWHADQNYEGNFDRLQNLVVFVSLSDIHTNGGGTVFLRGSIERAKELIAELDLDVPVKPKKLLAILSRREPWFRALTHKRMSEERRQRELGDGSTTSGSVEVKIQQQSSRAGDLTIWDARLLHSLGPNRSNSPRFDVRLDYRWDTKSVA